MRSSYCGRPTAEKSTCNITYDRDACDSATMASHNRSTSAAMYGRLRVCPTHGHFHYDHHAADFTTTKFRHRNNHLFTTLLSFACIIM